MPRLGSAGLRTRPTRRSAARNALAVLAAVSVAAPVMITASGSEASAAPIPESGVYLIWGTDTEATTMPFVRGGQVNVKWSNIEPSRGAFDWSDLDSELQLYHNAGKQATVQVNSQQKPAWIYSNGIERCGSYTRRGETYDIPRYWDPNFHVMMDEMLRAVAAHLRSSPYRSAVLGVRASPNLIGTEPYLLTDDGASPTAACLSEWTVAKGKAAYEKSMRLTYDAMMPDIRPILRSSFFLSINTGSLVRSELLGPDKAWVFGTNADPDDTLPAVDEFYNQWVKTGRTKGYYESTRPSPNHQLSWAYWRQLLDLGRGVSFIATYADDLRGALSTSSESVEYRAAFDFANKYAGFADKPATTPGGWVAFRGGPAATDDNYGMFVTQLNVDGTPGADSTTVAVDSAAGTNVIGPSGQRFGRFARRTDIASGRSRIHLRVAPEFKSTLSYGSEVAVTFLDSGSGTMTVKWGTGELDRRSFTKTGSGQWRRFVVDLPAGAMAGDLDATADLEISVAGSDTTFHMVEVDRRTDPVPVVALNAPSVARGTIGLTADSSAATGRTLSAVTFVVDDTVIAKDDSAPYQASWNSATAADGPHTLMAIATDSTGAKATSARTTIAVNNDITPPSAVADLTGFAPTATKVELRWSSAVDDLGISGYRILRNGSLLRTVEGLSAVDETVAPGTPYTYEVLSVDLAGNVSSRGGTFDVTTPRLGSGIVPGSTASASTYANALAIPAPPSAPGNVLLASISSRGDNVAITAPTGWKLVRRTDQPGYVNQAVYVRVAQATEPASYTWTMVGRHSVAGTVQAFAGVDQVNPVEASSGMGGSGDATITAPTITTLGPNRTIIGVYSVAAAESIAPPSALTELSEVVFNPSSRPPVALEVATATQYVAGATGSQTAVVAAGKKAHVGQLLALRPA